MKMSCRSSRKRTGAAVNMKFPVNKTKENSKSQDNDSKFQEILNKKWKVFRVSPIYNFSSNRLKFYEKKLNEEMNLKIKRTYHFGYKSKFTLNENLRLNDQCVEALKVEIIKEESQLVYSGYFISWSSSKPEVEGSVSLPILLVEAKTHEIQAVHSFLCKMFDCDIQPVTFSFYALITFFVKLLETPKVGVDVSQEQISLEYKIPLCEANDRIKISLFLEPTSVAFALIMDSLREKCEGITTIEIIWEFYNKILNHIFHTYSMDLGSAELYKITFSDAFLTSDGQVKMSSNNAGMSTLNILKHFTPLDAITRT